jgi:hypothetical protein
MVLIATVVFYPKTCLEVGQRQAFLRSGASLAFKVPWL